VSLRARKQVDDGTSPPTLISTEGSERPALRLIPSPTQVAEPPPNSTETHSPLTHGGAATEALEGHEVTSTHPPTVAEAAAAIWPSRDEVRHGFAGQVGSAAAGLAQVAGLGICWAAAHVLFSTKTAAAIAALVLLAVFAAIAIASHA
jgi:hypothetical protein